MRVLVGCEFSGVVRRAFRKRGHAAFSCDLLPADDESEYHIQGDIMRELLHVEDGHWDLMIAHPPCTYLTVSAAWAFTDGPYGRKLKPGTLVGAERRAAREQALAFVRVLMAAPIPRIAIENPVGSISTSIRKPDQIVQPFHFGDPFRKTTCLWLENLPKLTPTNDLGTGAQACWKQPPSPDRWKKRSITYQGIADAMAEQWGQS